MVMVFVKTLIKSSLSYQYLYLYPNKCFLYDIFLLFFISRMSILFIFVFVTFQCLLASVQANRTIIVPTDYGDILGYETNMARIFYGIPYAKPPVNDLRF